MRTRLLALLLTAAAAMLGTSLAVAAKRGGDGTDAVAASFTATPTAKTMTRTCTGVDGTYHVTRGVYEGTATGDARLAGRVTIRTHTVVNVTSGLGFTRGHIVVRETDGDLKARASILAVNSQRGVLNGTLRGRVKRAGDTAPGGELVANFTAAFNAAGTQLAGELGGGAAQNTAIVFSGTGCGKLRSTLRKASGRIAAITDTAITVQPRRGDALTCALTPQQKARLDLARAEVGDRAAMTCTADLRLVSLKLDD